MHRTSIHLTQTPSLLAGITKLRAKLKAANNIVILTGAGTSAESGIPTFRGNTKSSLWRQFDAMELATPEAFAHDPSLVWQFYQYRRNVVAQCEPNAGHYAIAKFQHAMNNMSEDAHEKKKNVTVLTQNIDRLHHDAGSLAAQTLELHGSLWLLKAASGCETQFTEDGHNVWEDRTNPLTPALTHDVCAMHLARNRWTNIPRNELPQTKSGELARPAVVWFGEGLDPNTIRRAYAAVEKADLILVVGTSSVVYPAAGFAEDVHLNGGIVAEINTNSTPISESVVSEGLSLRGASAKILPELFESLL